MAERDLSQFPELAVLRRVLRDTHPSFARVDDLLLDLAFDDAVSPELFDRVCDALFTVLNAYADLAAVTTPQEGSET